MKKQIKVLLGALALVVVGATVFAIDNPTQIQADLSSNYKGTEAFKLVDGDYLDNDFDGVKFPTDKCPNSPAYKIMRFGPKDYVTYLGQKIMLDDVDEKLTMSFKIGKKSYGVSMNQGTYVKPVSANYKGFSIKGLFAKHTSDGTEDEAIVVVSKTNYNITTGC